MSRAKRPMVRGASLERPCAMKSHVQALLLAQKSEEGGLFIIWRVKFMISILTYT